MTICGESLHLYQYGFLLWNDILTGTGLLTRLDILTGTGLLTRLDILTETPRHAVTTYQLWYV